MTKSTKALLLSALVYPGTGQLLLKRYHAGIAFIIISSFSLYFILNNTYKIASKIIENITIGGNTVDFTNLLSMVSQSETSQLNNAVTILSITWFVSLIHTYFIGRKTD